MAEQLTPQQWLEVLHAEQCRRWQQGERPLVEILLHQHPQLHGDTDCVLQLLNNEVVLREELAETPRLQEYEQRFPHLAGPLREMFEVHAALESEHVVDSTRRDSPGSPFPPPIRPAPVGRPAIPGYELHGELGRGGMGVVYRARHLGLQRLVALKMIRAGPHALAGELARFRAEAEAQARLQHPNVVQIFEMGEADGGPYFALEFVEGGSLAAKLAGTPQPARQAAELVRTLARALGHAHERGLVHRDLKPANVLLTADGIPKVTDFGLAKRLESGPGPTRSGDVLGTPSYMAPEQAAGRAKEVGPAADVYALGAILYETLTGRPPFLGESPMATLLQVQTLEPVPLRRLQPTVPRDLETICLKCLRKEPQQRYASAHDLADDLGRFLDGAPIQARPPGLWTQFWQWCRRPERVRDAGLYTVFLNAMLMLWELIAMIALAVGALSVPRPDDARWQLPLCFGIWSAFVFIGWATVRQKRGALILGLIASALVLATEAACVAGVEPVLWIFDIGGFFRSPAASPIYGLLVLLTGIQFVSYLFAVVADRSEAARKGGRAL